MKRAIVDIIANLREERERERILDNGRCRGDEVKIEVIFTEWFKVKSRTIIIRFMYFEDQ